MFHKRTCIGLFYGRAFSERISEPHFSAEFFTGFADECGDVEPVKIIDPGHTLKNFYFCMLKA